MPDELRVDECLRKRKMGSSRFGAKVYEWRLFVSEKEIMFAMKLTG